MRTYIAAQLPGGDWQKLIRRPEPVDDEVTMAVRRIIEMVKVEGDRAIRRLTSELDGVDIENIRIDPDHIITSKENIPGDLQEAVTVASANIESFHRAQRPPAVTIETSPGVICRRLWRPVEKVGLYIPGGTAPLLSTVLMLGIPAKLAGCPRIILSTPPAKNGHVPHEILYTAGTLGITEVYAIGGAQAIAAMALGTESIPRVDKIFGPGNRFVSAAKSLVTQPPYNVSIDVTAGPTELLILADDSANPSWIAADLLSQAEHGPGSQVVLVTDSELLIDQVKKECERQLQGLSRKGFIMRVMEESFSLLVASLEEGIAFANDYAPEHLQLATAHAEDYLGRIQHAGAVFIGSLSSVVFGDYASGPNHTLPTGGIARATGGVTIESYMKSMSVLEMRKEGCTALHPVVETLARAEGLDAHARAAAGRGTW